MISPLIALFFETFLYGLVDYLLLQGCVLGGARELHTELQSSRVRQGSRVTPKLGVADLLYNQQREECDHTLDDMLTTPAPLFQSEQTTRSDPPPTHVQEPLKGSMHIIV